MHWPRRKVKPQTVPMTTYAGIRDLFLEMRTINDKRKQQIIELEERLKHMQIMSERQTKKIKTLTHTLEKLQNKIRE